MADKTAVDSPDTPKEYRISLDGSDPTEASLSTDETAPPSPSTPPDVEAQDPSPHLDGSTPVPTKVPRSQRRGLLGRWTLVAEVDEPRNYSKKMKWSITMIVGVAAFAAPTGSAILFPSLADISTNLNATPTVTNLSVAFYMLALGVFPLFWSSFSESSGRRSIYVISFILAVIFNVLSAVSVNIGMFVVMRILSGGAAASVQVVGAGTIADVWSVQDRGKAIGIFYLGPLMGPMLAPTIGGALQIRFGWRSNFWFLSIFSFVAWLLLAFCLPETLKCTKPLVPELETEEKGMAVATRTSTLQSVHRKGKRAAWALHRTCIEPFGVLKNLRFPAVACTVYYACVTFGSLYVLNISVEATFTVAPYNFTALQLGLAYLANSSGYAIASFFGGRWTDWVMKRTAKRKNRRDEHGNLIFRTEDRVAENVWFAAALYPAALIWYGWSAQFHVHWAVPLLANFFFGIGSMLIFGTVTTMLTGKSPSRPRHQANVILTGLQSSCPRKRRLEWLVTTSYVTFSRVLAPLWQSPLSMRLVTAGSLLASASSVWQVAPLYGLLLIMDHAGERKWMRR